MNRFKVLHRRHRANFEQCESRHCLSAVAFVAYEIECCVGFTAEPVTADLDGDRDLDVLVGSYGDHSIAWYENTDGNGKFGPKQVIATQADPSSITAADLDGDGDLDVLAAVSDFSYGHRIVWYENTDGMGTFSEQRVISALEGARSVAAADLDGDGDVDVMSGSVIGLSLAGELVWYENTDGKGGFSPPRAIAPPRIGGGIYHILTADVDSDGDVDVVSPAHGWYENTDGKGSFGWIRPIGFTTHRGATADVDGDGDLDFLAAKAFVTADVRDFKIAWVENTDGKGRFGPERIITTQHGANWVTATDVDGDGDQDVLLAFDSNIAWYENTDGKGSFGVPEVIPRQVGGARSVTAADVDGDGDVDVLSVSYNGGINWYEQRLVGDSNDDGVFDSSDLVLVFTAGKYEDNIRRNSTFDEGDWNQDGDFSTTDLVLAFQTGRYEQVALAQPLAAVTDWLFATARIARRISGTEYDLQVRPDLNMD
jgi:hypothetical protein